jgi:hypothetical protein
MAGKMMGQIWIFAQKTGAIKRGNRAKTALFLLFFGNQARLFKKEYH